MFGFLKKKFGKSVDEARPAEQAAEEQTASEVRAEDLAGAPAPQAPAEASVAEAARRDAAEIDATAAPVEPAALPESPAQPAAEAAALVQSGDEIEAPALAPVAAAVLPARAPGLLPAVPVVGDLSREVAAAGVGIVLLIPRMRVLVRRRRNGVVV